MIRLIISILIFSLLIAVPPFLVERFDMPGMLVPKFWNMFIFFLIITYTVCIIVIAGQQRSGELGSQMFLIGTVIKLLACMTFALIYIRHSHVQPVRFVICFFYLYFLNTAFEIYVLISNLRVQNKK